MRRLGSLLLALASVVSAGPAWAASVRFTDSIDRNRVEIGGTVTVTVSVSVPDRSAIQSWKLPTPPSLEVVARSTSGIQMSFTFGTGGQHMSQTITHQIVMRALKTGLVTIPPATLRYDGKTYRTGSITITVLKTGQLGSSARRRPPPRRQNPGGLFGGSNTLGGSPFDPFGAFGGGQQQPVNGQDVFVRAAVDRKSVYLGEQVTLHVEVYSRVDVGDFPGFHMPKLDGFWTEDLDSPTRITPSIRYVNGVAYRVYLLRRQALFPLRSGKVTIDPVQVQITTGFGLFSQGRTVSRKSSPIDIDVKPLPAAGQPAHFASTNVGEWTLAAKVDSRKVTLGQPVTLDLTAEGQGNLDSLDLPDLPPVDGMKTYDPTRSHKKRISNGRFGGEKKVEWVLVPTRTGHLTIPGFTLAYFDPETAHYVTRHTEPIPVDVTAAAGQATAAGAAGAAAPAGPANVLDASGLRNIRYGTALHRVGPPLYQTRLFHVLLVAPVLAFALLLGVERTRGALRASSERNQGRRAPGVARARLKEARRLRAKGALTESFIAVERALLDYLTTRAGVQARGMSREALAHTLVDRGYAPLRVERLSRVLEDCEAARYSPVPPTDAEVDRLLDRAARVLADLDEGPGKREAA